MKKLYTIVMSMVLALLANAQNPSLLRDIFPGSTGSSIQQIVTTSNYSFFNAEDEDADADRGLYRTDGTAAGTIKLNLSSPTYLSTKAEKLTALGNKIIFAGDNFPPGYGEIWVSDGTQAGTFGIERFQPTPGTSRGPVMELVEMNGYVYYGVVTGNNKTQLRRTDGTPAGTSLVYEFPENGPDLALMKVINNVLYFTIYDAFGTGHDRLWRSDGTPAGTSLVYDFGTSYYQMGYYMPAGNRFLFMTANSNTQATVLFSSDGTPAGTSPLINFPSSNTLNRYPTYAHLNGVLYFAAHDGVNGKELWRSDGTLAGTYMASDIQAGAGSSNPAEFINLNNALYFSANNGSSGTELWKYNGTTAQLVKDIATGNANSSPTAFSISNGNLVFRASTAGAGAELWISDGTSGGTLQVADINPGTASSNPSFITSGDKVLFSANNGINGTELFVFNANGGVNALNFVYVNDGSQVSDVFSSAVGNDSNPGTAAAPVATIAKALQIASAGATIMIDAGTYQEQVIIERSVTLKGAGRALTTIAPNFSVTSLPAPQFHETGIIQAFSGIGNVHVTDLSIDGINTPNDQHSILIQGGGSVTNCEMRNVNNGPYMRDPSTASATAIVSGNYIHHVNYCGALFAGINLTCIANNNNFDHSNSSYGMGYLVGLDIGSVPSFTANNNIISNFNGWGINANILGGSISNNSIVGAGLSIIQNSSIQINATCNWYGSDDYPLVAPKISGAATYYPWLVSGVDAQVLAEGFQPFANTCTGMPYRNIYVNDGNSSGDVFTTAVGNDLNGNGSTINPYATINKAISMAVDGDRIYVDAGTYIEAVNVNKQVTLRGAKYGVAPGSSLDRGNESIIIPPFNNTSNIGTVITIAATNVVVDGFLIDGDNPAISGGIALNGADINAGSGIFNNNIAVMKMSAYNNIVKNVGQYGIWQSNALGNNPAIPGAGTVIRHNRIDNSNSRGLGLSSAAYGNITDNYITRVNHNGIRITNFFVASPDGSTVAIAGNKIDVNSTGIFNGNHTAQGPRTIIMMNEINISSSTGIGIDLSTFNSNGAMITWNKVTGGFNSLQSAVPSIVGTFDVTENSFTGYTNNAIKQSGPMPIRATCNWYGTADKNVIASKISGQVNYLPWLTSGVDGDALAPGFQPVAGTCVGLPKFYVNDGNVSGDVFTSAIGNDVSGIGTPAAPYATVIKALSVAQPGDSIFVDAGSYAESIIVNKSIVLLGARFGQAPGTSLNRGNESILHPATHNNVVNASVISVQSSDVTIDGFLIDGDNPGLSGGSQVNGIDVNIWAGIHNNNVAVSRMVVQNSIIKNAVAHGVGQINSGGAVTAGSGTLIKNNRIHNTGINGVLLGFNAYGDVIGNEISAANSHGIFLTTSTLAKPGGGVCLISQNKITTTSAGIRSRDFSINAPGIDIIANEIIITASNSSGIWISQSSKGANVFYNKITGGSLSINLNVPNSGAAINIENNSFLGYDVDAIRQIDANPINATCNWYGSTSQSDIAGSITGPVSYQPWLTNGTDALSNAGFQPVEGSCNGLPITLTLLSSSNVNCYDAANGSINTSIAGGVQPLTISWTKDGQPFSNLEDLNNLSPGIYVLNVTDAVGNSVSLNAITITQPAPLLATITNTSTNCSNNATVAISGGTEAGAYEILWSNGSTASNITDLPAGLYTVTVTDDNGCIDTAMVNLTVPESFNPSASVVNVTCAEGNNGSITVTNVNASGELSFSINGGNFVAGNLPYTFNNLLAGTYEIAVKTEDGCVGFVTKTVTQPPIITIVLTPTLVCSGNNNGTITTISAGGSGSHSYSWEGPGNFVSTQKNLSGLAPGLYELIVTDNKGCSAAAALMLMSTPAVSTTLTAVPVACRNTATGSMIASATGGSGQGFDYLWNTGATTPTITNLVAGNYSVTITDRGTGCIYVRSAIITQPASILAMSLVKTNSTGCALGSITATASGGTAPYSYSLNGVEYQLSNQFLELAAGSYTVWVKDANNCLLSKTAAITDNGSDAFEGNNSKNQAKMTGVDSVVNARIALATDVADWFKFTVPTTGIYNMELSHPATSFNLALYPSGNNVPALATASGNSIFIQRQLTAGVTYFIQISGGLSFKCYTLTITKPGSFVSGKGPNEAAVKNVRFDAISYPNPHHGSFTLRIEAPQAGRAMIEILSTTGQKIKQQTSQLQVGVNLVRFEAMPSGILLYRIILDGKVVSGKITGAK